MITAQEPTKAAGERLAVFRTIVEGYGAATHRLGAIIVLAVTWTALASGTGYLVEEATHASGDLRAHYSFATVIRAWAAGVAQYVELLLAASLVAIAVYRAIILGEKQTWKAAMRMGRREMRFLGLAALFSLPAHLGAASIAVAVNLRVAPIMLMQALAAIGIPELQAMSLILAAHLLVSLALTPFLALAFPLIATGAPGATLRQSLRLGRNHRVRLAAVGFLAPLPLMPFAYAPYLARIPDTVTVLVLRSVVGNFLSLVASALVTGVFAVAFQRVTAHSNKGTYDVFD
jgi:hypothetical protein